MSIRVEGDVIHIEGAGKVDDADPLLEALMGTENPIVDIGAATRLHLAIVQLLMASRVTVRGVPADPFLRDHVRRLLET